MNWLFRLFKTKRKRTKTFIPVDIGIKPGPARDHLVSRHRFKSEELFGEDEDVLAAMFPHLPLKKKISPGDEWFDMCAESALRSKENLAFMRRWSDALKKEKQKQGEKV